MNKGKDATGVLESGAQKESDFNKKIHLGEIIDRFFTATFTIQRKLGPMLRDEMPEELTSDQFLTIRFLRGHSKVTSSELADSFGVGKSSITAIITRLSEKGIVERESDEKDRRVAYLCLTEMGRKLCQQAEENLAKALGEYMFHFSEEESEQFMSTYERLAKVLAQPDEGSNREI